MLGAANTCALELMQQHAAEVQRVAGALLKRRALAHADILALLARQAGGKRQGTSRPRSRHP
jgi:hypothetical protein